MKFAEILKGILIERGMKQADLCRMTGIPSSLMSEYMTGKKSPAISNAVAISKALGVSLDDLTGRSQPSIPYSRPVGWDDLDEADQQRVEDFITALLSAEKYSSKEGGNQELG